jgi:hypothetical protein
MVTFIIPVIAALIIPASYAFSPIVPFHQTNRFAEKEQERIPAFNSSSHKQIKHVSEKAVDHSPVLSPCDNSENGCLENWHIIPTAVPTLYVTIVPTEQPLPTVYPTIIVEPTGLVPIDPPPCGRGKFEIGIKERPMVSDEENIMMPCIYLDQQ